MNLIAQIAALLLGLLGGALLLLALAFVPYWQSLDPLEFTQWFGANLHFIADAMMPIGVSATGITLLATGLAVWNRLPTLRWLVAASVITLCMFATFPIYFSGVNAALAEGAMSAAEASQQLAQWQGVHWFRTVAAIAACFCAISAGYAKSGIRPS